MAYRRVVDASVCRFLSRLWGHAHAFVVQQFTRRTDEIDHDLDIHRTDQIDHDLDYLDPNQPL